MPGPFDPPLLQGLAIPPLPTTIPLGGAGWTDDGTVVRLTAAEDQVSIGGAGSALSGVRLTLNNTTANKGLVALALAGTERALSSRVTGDTRDRWQLQGGGTTLWGSGSATADVRMYRSGTGVWTLDDTAGVVAFQADFATAAGTFLNAVTSRSSTNTVIPVLTLGRKTTGTPAAGCGGSIDFQTQDSAGGLTNAGRVACVPTTVTAGAEVTDLRFANCSAASSFTEKWRMRGSDGSLVMMTNASILPNTDGQGTLGSTSARFNTAAVNTYNVFNAVSDVNATAALSSAALRFGPGGNSALDVKLTRSNVATLQVDNNAGGAVTIVPAADNLGSIGTNGLRWALVRATTITSGFLGETEVFPEESLAFEDKVQALQEDMVPREFPEVPGDPNMRHNARVTFVGAQVLIELVAQVQALRDEVATLRGN